MHTQSGSTPRRIVLTAAVIAAAAGMLASGCSRGGGRISTNQSSRLSGPVANAPAVAPNAIEAASMRERAVAILIEGASSDSAERRANSIEGLSITPSRLRPLLPAALVDENLGVRSVAAMVVGRLKLTQLTHAVRPLVHDRSPMVRMAAIYALHRCGDTGPDADISPIGRMLWDESPRVRAQAAFILGELGDRSAVPMLKESLRSSMNRATHNEVRLMQLQAAEARAKLGDDDALHEIRAALYPSRPDDLEAAALAAQILGLVGDRRSTDQLIYLTARQDESGHPMPAEVRLAAAASLALLGMPQGGFLAREFAGSDRAVLRAQSAHVFGQTGLGENLPALALMMDDPDPLVRTAAAAGVLKITERPGMGGSRR